MSPEFWIKAWLALNLIVLLLCYRKFLVSKQPEVEKK